jgi:CheY-like chemotaxis protein
MTTLNKIMLVDDEEDIRTVAEISLCHVGQWEAVVVSSGIEALELAPECQPDLILLDVMMPALDGPSTLKKLRENEATKDIPVIFLTAKVQPNEVSEYLQLGALGVVAKPFDPMLLPDEIKRIYDENV